MGHDRVSDSVRMASDVDDGIRSAATRVFPALIEAELTAVRRRPQERTEASTAKRNGSRPRTLSTAGWGS